MEAEKEDDTLNAHIAAAIDSLRSARAHATRMRDEVVKIAPWARDTCEAKVAEIDELITRTIAVLE